MRRLILGLIAVLALLLAACGNPEDQSQALRYGYDAGDELVYDTEMSMQFDTDIVGGPVEEQLPGSFALGADLVATTRYLVAEGADAGTFAVTMSLDALEFSSVEMTMAGEELTFTDPALMNAALEGQDDFLGDVTFVVDEQGTVRSIEVDGQNLNVDELLGADPFSGMSQGMPFLGPQLAEGAVAVGDSWSSTWSSPMAPGVEEVEVTATHRFAAIEDLEGREVYRIESVTETARVEFNSEDLLSGGDFGGQELSPSDLEGLATGNVEMAIVTDPGTATVWFDPVEGITVRQAWTAGARVVVSVTGFEDLGGETGTIEMHTTMKGQLALRA